MDQTSRCTSYRGKHWCLCMGKGRGELTGSEGVWTKGVTGGSQDIPSLSKNRLDPVGVDRHGC